MDFIKRKCCSNCGNIKTIWTTSGLIAAHKCGITDSYIWDYTRYCIDWCERGHERNMKSV